MHANANDAGSSAGLVRGLGSWAATAIVVGAMIGQSVFLVSSDMSREVGSLFKVLTVWIVGGAIVLCGALCYGELGASMPETGGDYIYLSRGLNPLCGFLYGWTSATIMKPGAAATVAAGLVRLLGFLVPSVTAPLIEWHQLTLTAAQLLAAAAIVVVTALNYLSVRTVGRFQVFLTSLKIAAVAMLVVLGFTATGPAAPETGAIPPLAHGPLLAFLTALVPVMAAYNGFQLIGAVGGEVLRPQKNIPRAAIAGTSLVIVLYVMINWVYFHLLGFSHVARSQHVASDAAVLLIGSRGARWFTVAMILSAFGSLHAGFLTGPRIPYAMARAGNFFAFAGRIQPTFHTPSGAVLFQGCVAVLLVLTGTHQDLYSYSMFAIWAFSGLTALALIRLRGIEPGLARPFRVWGYPWTPLVFGTASLAIAVNLCLVRPVRSSIGMAIILLGIPFFRHWRAAAWKRTR
jgi:amino acid transporter